MSTVENADMIRSAREAQQPHPHEINAFTERCDACHRTAQEIFDKGIPCTSFINRKPVLPPW